jgi:hypothetical protein
MLCVKGVAMDIEDRIFELSGEVVMVAEIVAVVTREYDVDEDTAWALALKVRKERTTPHLVAAKEAIDRLYEMSYY